MSLDKNNTQIPFSGCLVHGRTTERAKTQSSRAQNFLKAHSQWNLPVDWPSRQAVPFCVHAHRFAGRLAIRSHGPDFCGSLADPRNNRTLRDETRPSFRRVTKRLFAAETRRVRVPLTVPRAVTFRTPRACRHLLASSGKNAKFKRTALRPPSNRINRPTGGTRAERASFKS